MKLLRKPRLRSAVAVLLILCMVLPINALAAVSEPVMPLASNYLFSYFAYVHPTANGDAQVWFNVEAQDYMDTLGAKSIAIQRSYDNKTWITVEVYTVEDTPSLMGSNTYTYTSHVDYDGAAGVYYRAYVGIWAGKDGCGDTRYFYTDSELAT